MTELTQTPDWSFTEWEWDAARARWRVQPTLTIAGESFVFATRREYIDKMRESGLPEESYQVFADSLEAYPDPLPRTTGSNIGIGLIGVMMTGLSVRFIHRGFTLAKGETILPPDCVKSDFFWILLVIAAVFAVAKGYITKYTVMVKGGGGRAHESMDMDDQALSGLMTILSPVFAGLGITLPVYYAIYWLTKALTSRSPFLFAVAVFAVYALTITVFLKWRPRDNRRREIVWFVKWGLVTALCGTALMT